MEKFTAAAEFSNKAWFILGLPVERLAFLSKRDMAHDYLTNEQPRGRYKEESVNSIAQRNTSQMQAIQNLQTRDIKNSRKVND